MVIIPQLFFKNKSIYRDQHAGWTPKQCEPECKTDWNGWGCPLPASAGTKTFVVAQKLECGKFVRVRGLQKVLGHAGVLKS